MFSFKFGIIFSIKCQHLTGIDQLLNLLDIGRSLGCFRKSGKFWVFIRLSGKVLTLLKTNQWPANISRFCYCALCNDLYDNGRFDPDKKVWILKVSLILKDKTHSLWFDAVNSTMAHHPEKNNSFNTYQQTYCTSVSYLWCSYN